MARTRAADYDDKREAILRRSAAVFAEYGIDRASMAQVAGECGVSKALLYHYYDSKEALLQDIIRSHLEELDAAVAEADDPALPAERRLRLLIGRVLECYRDADDLHQVQITGMRILPPERAEQLKALERRIVARFGAVLREVNPALDAGRPLLKPVTMSLFGMLNWVYMWFRPDGGLSRDEYADLATALILDGVRAVK